MFWYTLLYWLRSKVSRDNGGLGADRARRRGTMNRYLATVSLA